MNSSVGMLCLYAGSAFAASLAGGELPFVVRLTHTRLQTALSFIAGLMLGLALLQLIPHASAENHSLDGTVAWVLGGFLALFFLQRVFHYHQHGLPSEANTSGVATACGHGAHPTSPDSHKLSWLAVALGLGFHSLLDGLALATAVAADPGATAGSIGLATALAVILHKPFDAMAVVTLMHSSGCAAPLRRRMNIAVALVTPLGVLLASLGLGTVAATHHELLGCALAFCAGGFLCIACSDLLPELHFHSHDRLRLSLALLAGVAVSVLVGSFDDHHHSEAPQHAHPGTHSSTSEATP